MQYRHNAHKYFMLINYREGVLHNSVNYIIFDIISTKSRSGDIV
jgi:hypothetical protein